MVVLGGAAVPYERGTPVLGRSAAPHARRVVVARLGSLQGYLAHKNTPPPRTSVGP